MKSFRPFIHSPFVYLLYLNDSEVHKVPLSIENNDDNKNNTNNNDDNNNKNGVNNDMMNLFLINL